MLVTTATGPAIGTEMARRPRLSRRVVRLGLCGTPAMASRKPVEAAAAEDRAEDAAAAASWDSMVVPLSVPMAYDTTEAADSIAEATTTAWGMGRGGGLGTSGSAWSIGG